MLEQIVDKMRALKGVIDGGGEAVRQGRGHDARRRRRPRAGCRDLNGLARARSRDRDRRVIRGAASSRSTGRSRAERRRSRSTRSPRRRGPAAWPRSSTPSTRSTSRTRGRSASRRRSSSSRSRTRASRRSTSPRCSFDRRDRSRGHRLGRRAHAESGARGRDGRRAHGTASASDEPGAAKADGGVVPQRNDAHVPQSAAAEDRRDVRLTRRPRRGATR